MSSSSFREAVSEALDELGIVESKPKRKNHRGGKYKQKRKASVAKAAGDALTAKMIHFKRTEDKGIGTFAAQNIKKGTRILSESPLIELPQPGMNKPQWAQDAMERYEALPKDKQDIFINLYCRIEKPLLRQLTVEAIQSGDIGSNEIQISEIEDIQDFPDGPIKQKLRVAGTFQINAFGLSGEEPHNVHVAVFEYGSRINHSCVPNTWHSWNKKTQKHNFHAVRDIAVGEEITTEYVYSLDLKEKRQITLELYGIDCRCRACVDEVAEGRRAAIHFLRKEEFGQFKQQLDAGGSLSLEEFRQALEIIEKLVKLFEAEDAVGVHYEEMQVWCSPLLYIIFPRYRNIFY